MNVEKGNTILKLVDGLEVQEGLATVALALIHLCMKYGYTKDECVENFASQWDRYEKFTRQDTLQ